MLFFCHWKYKEKCRRKKGAGAFLDLAKAFDSILDKSLLKKLKNINFDEKTITMMET